MTDITKLGFDSRINYMKRSSFVASTPLTLPGAGSSVTASINHSLNYIPYFDVFMDFSNDGVIWNGEKVDIWTDSSLSTSTINPRLRTWVTTSVLGVDLLNDTSPTATGSRTLYYLIYLDYGTS